MADFEFTRDGIEYSVSADDSESALKKLKAHLYKEDSKLSPENHPFTKLAIDPARTLAAVKTMARRIPAIGNYIPEDDYEKQYAKEAPYQHMGAQALGTVLPLAASSAALATPQVLSRGAPWLGAQVTGAAAIGGADKAAQQHSQGQDLNTADILKAMGVEGGMAAVGAGVSRVITPKPFVPPKSYVPEPPKGNSYEDVWARTRYNNPGEKRTREQLAELINARRLEMARAAHEAAEPSKWATNAARVASGLAAPHIDPTGGIAHKILHGIWDNRLVNNQIMADPQRAAIMQALMMGGGQQFNRIPDASQ